MPADKATQSHIIFKLEKTGDKNSERRQWKMTANGIVITGYPHAKK